MAEQSVQKKKNWVDFRAVKEKADFRQVLAHNNLELQAKGSELVGSCPGIGIYLISSRDEL